MSNKFRVRICSDLDYEKMVADICYENYVIAMISQENGIDNMEVEIFNHKMKEEGWKFLLNDFIESILTAKNQLIKMQKISE